MRISTACVCAGLIASAATLGGQQAPSFRSGVSLVTVDVTVLDKDGRPVPGLTAADFEIKLNGKAQPVRAASFVHAADGPAVTVTAAPAALPAPMPAISGRTVTNWPPPPPPPAVTPAPAAAPVTPGEPRVFIILADDLSFSPLRGKALFIAAKRFIDRLPASDLIGFTTSSGTGAINPTADRAPIRAALDKVTGLFNDPRSLKSRGQAAGNAANGTGNADGGPSLDESLDVDGPNPMMLKNVIARECFNGSTAIFNTMSIEEVIVHDQCASDMKSEARRTAALTRQTVATQIRGYLSVITAMRVASGIRHLIVLSDGLAVQKEPTLLTPVARAAAEAGVQVSVMLEEPDLNLADEGRRDRAGEAAQPDVGQAQRRREDDKMLISGAQTVADMTGGLFYRVIGTPDPSFDRIAVASSAVYRLGIEPPSDTVPGRSFTVAAALPQRHDLTIRVNRHAVAAAARSLSAPAVPAAPAAPATPAAPVSIDERLRTAVVEGKPLFGVPLVAAAMVRRSATAPGQVDVTVNVEVPASVKGPLTTMLGLVDEKGGVRTAPGVAGAPADGSPYAMRFLVPVTPGLYRVRFAAADAAGSIGTIESPLGAMLTPMGPVTTSDVMTWFTDAAGKAQLFALEDVPRGVATLNASLELYLPDAAKAPGDLRVRWTIVPAGQEKPAVEQEAEPHVGPGLLRADAAFEVKDLPAGVSTLRATLLVGGAEAGTASTTIKKR